MARAKYFLSTFTIDHKCKRDKIIRKWLKFLAIGTIIRKIMFGW